jgi:hypothetical protein
MLDSLAFGGRPTLRFTKQHLIEDLRDLKSGLLDLKSFFCSRRPYANYVTTIVRNAKGDITQKIYSHNLRTTVGNQNQRIQMFGNVSANSTFSGNFGASTACTATTLTVGSATFPTTGGGNPLGGLQGQIVFATSSASLMVYGVILSNTTTVLTVDQWYNMTSTSGAVGTTPVNVSTYVISPNAAPAVWMGVTTDATTAAITDVLSTAAGLFTTGIATGSATEQTANGLQRAFVQPSFSSNGTFNYATFVNTFTYTTTGAVTIPKAILCNSKAGVGSLLFLDTLLSAPATVNASGDSCQNTWQISLSPGGAGA